MAITELLVKTLKALPPERQQQVLDFARSLATSVEPKNPLTNIKGMFADLNIHISAEDIDEARREMWGNFPRADGL